jgi:hypothetical protein
MAETRMEKQVVELITTLDGELFTLHTEGRADLAVARFPTHEFAEAFCAFCRRYNFPATDAIGYSEPRGNEYRSFVIFGPSQDARL